MPKKKSKDRPETSEETAAPSEAAETRLLVRFGFELAREVGVSKVLVLSQLVRDRRLVERHRESETLIWVTQDEKPPKCEKHEHYVEVPRYRTDRLSQLTLGLIVAVLKGIVTVNESVVCLTGVAGSKRLDNLLIANPKRDFPWFSHHAVSDAPAVVANLKEFVRLVEIALRFASEGREGKPIGTIFVLGDVAELGNLTRPLILNPLEGHNRKSRSIHDPEFFETMRELAAVDGAFLIDTKGVVERAGAYVDAPLTSKVKVPKGMGSRHMSAAALTAKTDATSIVISESSGAITVYCRGEEIMKFGGRG